MGPWQSLLGVSGYLAGASGTAQLPAGASVLQIVAHSTAGGTVVILGGPSIPIIANTPLVITFRHVNFQAQGATATSGTEIVFTGTDSYFVEYVAPGA